MALFKTGNCMLCGEETGIMSGVIIGFNKVVCENCLKKLNITIGYTENNIINSYVQDFKSKREFVKNKIADNSERIKKFNATSKIGNYIWFDDNNEWFAIPQKTSIYPINNSYVFSYKDIISFELLEDNTVLSTSISKSKGGLGRAAVGGFLLGGVGAVVGAATGRTKTMSTKSEEICTKLQIKLITNWPIVYINLINHKTKKSSHTYKKAFKYAQEIIAKFQIIDSNRSDKNNLGIFPTDEIRKYKELLEIGAITQEEFDKKKKQLLNL